MRVDAFDFDLPQERIALRPVEPREAGRLLEVKSGEPFHDHRIGALPSLLQAGDVLVVNNTRVLPARLRGHRRRGETVARIEALLHKRDGADRWHAFVRPAKKLAVGESVAFGTPDDPLDATCLERGEGGEILLAFSLAGPELDRALERHGAMPLPPYIAGQRATDERDRTDYQTLFAREDGAVAAPTASLHFTPALMDALSERGVRVVTLTLHVGAGTFLPVKADDTRDHRMHAEWGRIDEATASALNTARTEGHRIVAAGTTSLRLLETAADATGVLHPFVGDTSIFITPGYRFRAVDLLLTNFHLPRSTLFMLVAAFAGLSTMRHAYAHAVANEYRFYSYGDACLLHCAHKPA